MSEWYISLLSLVPYSAKAGEVEKMIIQHRKKMDKAAVASQEKQLKLFGMDYESAWRRACHTKSQYLNAQAKSLQQKEKFYKDKGRRTIFA